MIDYTKRMAVAAMLAAAMLAPSGFAALADDTKADAQALVDKATVTVKNFSSDPDMTWFRDNAPKAKGLLFVPRVIRGGLILGGTGGTGVLLARDGNGGDWSDPAFYTVGSVTIGLQIGGEVSELVLIVMSQKGMDALLSTDLKLGGDASVAAGPVGAGAKAQTADVISFSRTKGAFAGVNLEGAVVAVRAALNAAGAPATMAGSGAPRRAAARRRPAGRRAGPARGFWAAPALLLCVLLASACAPQQQGLGPERGAPRLQDDSFFARDGAQLPVRIWPAGGETRAAVVALHGLNVYSRIFDDAAPWWAEQGIAVYAYDQRGFGGGPRPGIWGGAEAFVADARDMLQLVGARHPGAPVFLLGESMGAAVTLLTLAELAAGGTADAVPPAGAVLVAPAVWGGEAMNPAFRGGLWFAAHTMPWNRATGDGLQRRASDNIELLRELGRDPLVIKHTRVDVVYQATQLMGSAYAAAGRLDDVPVLVLYGARDEIVPPQPVQGLAAGLSAPYRLVLYPDGWHMLLRDLQAQVVWRDVAAWIADPAAPLPSAHEIALADWADVED